jgi:hypothetical protein
MNLALTTCAGLNLSSLLGPSSLAWIQLEERTSITNAYQGALVFKSDISLGFVATENAFFAWATSNTDGQPVAGVEITVHSYGWQVGILLVAIFIDANGVI